MMLQSKIVTNFLSIVLFVDYNQQLVLSFVLWKKQFLKINT